MKKTILALSLLSAFSTFASVEGLTIPNSHQVDRHGHVFRGKEPGRLVSELRQIGITDVLIFKNDVKGEVLKEQVALKELGIRSYNIPFKWKEYPSMQEACVQIADALTLITKVKAARGAIYFHCTAGEDRTGTLAGLYRMLEERIPAEQVFRTEMCARGFSDGNPNKPPMVTNAIQKELTPLFIALAEKIQTGEWQLGRIDKRSCARLNLRPTRVKCRN